jgi:hypothetical protein
LQGKRITCYNPSCFGLKKGRIFMKKLLISALILVMTSSLCFAVGAGPSIRSMAMGGVGIAIANDITAAYFNPAGLMFGPENFETQLFAGGATNGITAMTDVMSSGNKFIEKFFGDDISLNASVFGGLGMSVRKVGLSALAMGSMHFKKPAFKAPVPSQINLSFNGNVNVDVPLTLGSSISTPGLPLAALAVGVNLKSINVGLFSTKVSGGYGTSTAGIGSGFGFDIGAQAKVTPLIMVGAVVRNLSASVNMTTTTKNITVDALGNVTEGTDSDTKKTFTPAPETGIGAGIIFPLTGTLVAVDLENYSAFDDGSLTKSSSYTDTHIGIEQALYLNMVVLRAGYFTYGAMSDAFYTYGLGLNFGPANLGIAASNSTKDSRDSMNMAQIGVSF